MEGFGRVGMVWNGLEMIRNGISSKIEFSARERSNVPLNVQTLGLAENGWDCTFEHSFRTFERGSLLVIWRGGGAEFERSF